MICSLFRNCDAIPLFCKPLSDATVIDFVGKDMFCIFNDWIFNQCSGRLKDLPRNPSDKVIDEWDGGGGHEHESYSIVAAVIVIP